MTAYSKDFKGDALKYIEEHPDMKSKDVADRLGIPVGTPDLCQRSAETPRCFEKRLLQLGQQEAQQQKRSYYRQK